MTSAGSEEVEILGQMDAVSSDRKSKQSYSVASDGKMAFIHSVI